MAKLNGKHPKPAPEARPQTSRYANPRCPTPEELMAEQGTGPITDISQLRADFWPEEESIDEFVATYREWRGHKREDPAA